MTTNPDPRPPRAGDLDEKGLAELRRVFPAAAIRKIEEAAYRRGWDDHKAHAEYEATHGETR